MDFETIWGLLKGLLPAGPMAVVQYVLMCLGALVVVGGAFVKLTPSQEDDAFMAKLMGLPVLGSLLKFLEKFSPLARKE